MWGGEEAKVSTIWFLLKLVVVSWVEDTLYEPHVEHKEKSSSNYAKEHDKEVRVYWY